MGSYQTMEQEELIPCPFCKGLTNDYGESVLSILENKAGNTFVECLNCGASGPISYQRGEQGEAEAIEKWNQRQS